MSSTRHAADGSFHQERYASSPEFQHGLVANLVAKRTAQSDIKADRQLIWFIQYLSLLSGGLAALAAALLKRFPHRLGTTTMVSSGKGAGQSYAADEVREIRAEMPIRLEELFPLRGELTSWDKQRFQINRIAARYKVLDAMRAMESYEAIMTDHGGDTAREELRLAEAESHEIEAEKAAALVKFPDAYPVENFLAHCREAAERGGKDGDDFLSLEKELARLCLDPARDLKHGPWYFQDLFTVLREYRLQWDVENARGVETNVFHAVEQMIDFTMQAGGLTLLTGPSNVGARFAAREVCRRSAGRVRFAEVPATNDDATFYQEIGRALGGNWLNYKPIQIRSRIEPILQSGELTLVLYSAQNLWPVLNLREGFPKRLAWLIQQTEKGASVCMISSPQFFMQKRSCDKSGWDSPEIRNFLSHVSALPESLTVDEMTAIARTALPLATPDDCVDVAINAVASNKYLANVAAVSKWAQYLADKSGRIELTAADFDQAIECVNKSDTLLRASLEQNQNPKVKPGRKSNRAAQPSSAPVVTINSPRPPAPAEMPRNRIAESPMPATAPERSNLAEHVTD